MFCCYSCGGNPVMIKSWIIKAKVRKIYGSSKCNIVGNAECVSCRAVFVGVAGVFCFHFRAVLMP